MLGSKRSVPLWKQRRARLLPLEQSLAAGGTSSRAAKPAVAAKAIKVARTRSRMMAEAKRMGRFSEA